MPLTDLERLQTRRAQPRIMQLWQAMSGLRSVVSFMQSGAHPDDETSAMLAALRYRDGLATSYVCSTRGEGGQNDLGTESGADLGLLRTAEMQQASAVLDMNLWWIGHGPDDPIHDFGFSKSGHDTMSRWGRDRLLARFVRVLRLEKPDILCPTFLDVPGQHGHHRAMTEAAGLAMTAAADPGYSGSDLPVWQVSKLYLPAWGGGGTSYDDELPPPAATVIVPVKGTDPVSGWSWEEIGQQSRMYHASQGMGRWIAPDAERDWPLHLAISHVGPDFGLSQGAVTDNLPADLAALGLPEADQAIQAAFAEFGDSAAVFGHISKALRDVAEGAAQVAPEHLHRVRRKQAELTRVLRIASGVEARLCFDSIPLRPGEHTAFHITHRPAEHAQSRAELVLPEGWQQQGGTAGPEHGHVPNDPFVDGWSPLTPAQPALSVTLSFDGIEATSQLSPEIPPLLSHERTVRLNPDRIIVNRAVSNLLAPITCEDPHPVEAKPVLRLPTGWRQTWHGQQCQLEAPEDQGDDLLEIPLTLDNEPAVTETLIHYPHIVPQIRSAPAILRLRFIKAEIPKARVGYIGGGNDNLAQWLPAMGISLTEIDDDLRTGDWLSSLDSLIIGVFAFRSKAGLRAIAPRLREWVERGGNLVTLYHRPRDDWDPQETPPRPIEIGQPSLRWRVTDENAAVRVLSPEHPVLNFPNLIGPEDWMGWVKERGLYFASKWHPAYSPLLEMADPNEAPLRGALLNAEIGAGSHSHVALGIHTQLDNLVPGAFRLLANLIRPTRDT